MIVMSAATAYHIYRNENSSAVTTAVVFLIVTFVAYRRWKVNPILSKTEKSR
jgi:hypothetical protein